MNENLLPGTLVVRGDESGKSHGKVIKSDGKGKLLVHWQYLESAEKDLPDVLINRNSWVASCKVNVKAVPMRSILALEE